MKTIQLFFVGFSMVLVAQRSFAQKSGLFLTANDFEQHKLNPEISCNQKGNKIRLNEFFNSPTVDVFVNGEKKSFRKNEVFGYANCDGTTYRFFDKKAYKIVDTDEFYLYTKNKNVPDGKRQKQVTEYFFSVNANSDVEPLSMKNMELAYLKNYKFHYWLEEEFKSDKELAAYDSFQKTYKVKYLLKESMK